jgi:Protein kinase domain
LIDFGISKKIDSSIIKEEMTVIGTESYFSPELFEAEDQDKIVLNPFKSDVFSLGLIFLKIALKEAPFRNSKRNRKINLNEYELEIQKEIKRFYEMYKGQTKDFNEEGELVNMKKYLQKMMRVNYEKRCDFLELFRKSIKMCSVEDMREIILLQEKKNQDPKNIVEDEKTMIKKSKFFFPPDSVLKTNEEIKENIKKDGTKPKFIFFLNFNNFENLSIF